MRHLAHSLAGTHLSAMRSLTEDNVGQRMSLVPGKLSVTAEALGVVGVRQSLVDAQLSAMRSPAGRTGLVSRLYNTATAIVGVHLLVRNAKRLEYVEIVVSPSEIVSGLLFGEHF